MIFQDRRDAGKKLVPSLKKYAHQPDTVVIGLPRGGVVTAYEVAAGLHLPLDVIFPRKVGAPFNPELAIGAVTETGEGVFNESLIEGLRIPSEYIQETIQKEKKTAQERLNIYRKKCPKIPLEGKSVIIVDDGLATGATMKAAIQSIKAEGADRIIVAVPVAPQDTYQEIKELVDEIIVLHAPSYFMAVGQFYHTFDQTENDEVVALLQKSRASL